MLTPVSQVSAQSAAGGNLRSAAAEGLTDRQVKPAAPIAPEKPVAASAGENTAIDRLRILLIAAGVSQQGLLQKLADMIARSLRFERLPGETTEKFLARLAVQLDNLPPARRLMVEIRTGLRPVGISLSTVAQAFRDPSGPQSAHLAALLETPDFNAADAPAQAALKSYLDDGAGQNRSAETLQAQTAARESSNGQNIYATQAGLPDNDIGDARNLQTRLAQVFTETEDGMPEAANAAKAAATSTAAPTEKPAGAHKSAAGLAPENAADDDIATTTRDIIPSKGRTENSALRNGAEPRQPTMMILRGLTEVIGNLADRASETLRNVAQPLPGEKPAIVAPQTAGPLPASANGEDAATHLAGKNQPAGAQDAKDAGIAQSPLPVVDEPADAEVRAKPLAAAALLARQSESAEAIAQEGRLAQRFGEPLPVPFANVPYPVRDSDGKYPAGRHGSQGASDEGADDQTDDDADEDQDDQSARRQKAVAADEIDTDDEEIIELNRSSTDADRAFRHYQRMRGF